MMNAKKVQSGIPLTWEVGFSNDPAATPERFVPAVVPGAVQLDWARAEGWPDYNFGDNWRAYGWMEDVCWLYRARLEFDAPTDDQRVFFVSGGVDYAFQVRVGGRVLLEQEGMFTPVELDLTDVARPGDLLELLVLPAPKSVPEPQDRAQANASCKPAVSYGWDFHPRLIPSGIWDETYLELRPACHIRSAEVRYELSDDFACVDVRAEVALSATGGSARWRLCDPDGAIVIEQTVPASTAELCLRAKLDAPQLWWPNGEGEPVLYDSTIELLDAGGEVVQRTNSRVGFRRVRLVMHDGAWEDPHMFPKSRSNPPITVEVNGRRIFAKGSNWVCPDIFPGRVTRDVLADLLGQVRAAHMNLLRCWGGAAVQKEAFFDLADELGIMLWQEFPLSCNRYEGTPEYLRVLDQESRSIIRRLRPHASVVLWCGGNELFNKWSGMTEQDLPIRLLNRNCYDLSPDRPFLPTSPVMGMGHGWYGFGAEASDEHHVFHTFAESACTAYAECGIGAYAPVDVLREVLHEDDLRAAIMGGDFATRRAFSHLGDADSFYAMSVEGIFSPPSSIEELVECDQFLQSQGLKCIFEEGRRQKPRCSMVLNWCLNEPWPAIRNLSVISWPARPKSAMAAIGQSCRPTLASARVAKFQWREGEAFEAELFLLNDAPMSVPRGRIEAVLDFDGQELFLLAWDHNGTPAGRNLAGPTARIVLPHRAAGRMRLILRDLDDPTCDSEYWFLYDPCEAEDSKAGAPAMNA